MARIHFTSHSQRDRCGSNSPVKRTGYVACAIVDVIAFIPVKRDCGELWQMTRGLTLSRIRSSRWPLGRVEGGCPAHMLMTNFPRARHADHGWRQEPG